MTLEELTETLAWSYTGKEVIHRIVWLREAHVRRIEVARRVEAILNPEWQAIGDRLRYRRTTFVDTAGRQWHEVQGYRHGEWSLLVSTFDIRRFRRFVKRANTNKPRRIQRKWYALMRREYQERKERDR